VGQQTVSDNLSRDGKPVSFILLASVNSKSFKVKVAGAIAAGRKQMSKRFMLALAFAAAFSLVGFSLSNEAQAWRGYYGRPYRAYYAPAPVYYAPTVVPYRAYYPAAVVRPYYPAPVYYSYPYPGYPGGYYYGSPGVSVSVGL
jgi:hypothetical protein